MGNWGGKYLRAYAAPQYAFYSPAHYIISSVYKPRKSVSLLKSKIRFAPPFFARASNFYEIISSFIYADIYDF